jgi:hypothetical protein
MNEMLLISSVGVVAGIVLGKQLMTASRTEMRPNAGFAGNRQWHLRCLLFDDHGFCRYVAKLLESYCNRPIAEIGSLDPPIHCKAFNSP